jgi:hypothetical protein
VHAAPLVAQYPEFTNSQALAALTNTRVCPAATAASRFAGLS